MESELKFDVGSSAEVNVYVEPIPGELKKTGLTGSKDLSYHKKFTLKPKSVETFSYDLDNGLNGNNPDLLYCASLLVI